MGLNLFFIFLAIDHVWIAGRLNMTKDSEANINYMWYNPYNGKRILDNGQLKDPSLGLYVSFNNIPT